MVAPALLSSQTDEWATPQELFDKLDATFHFTLDPCATEENHKCEKYFTREQDGLKQDWGGGDYLVQSALREDNQRLGQEMRTTSRNRRHANPGPYRHEMVAREHQPKSERTGPIHQRSAEIRRSQEPRAFPERNRNLHKHPRLGEIARPEPLNSASGTGGSGRATSQQAEPAESLQHPRRKPGGVLINRKARRYTNSATKGITNDNTTLGLLSGSN